jgi:rhomboid family GlyGly-CTERM serine protease
MKFGGNAGAWGRRVPWLYLALFVVALVVQLHPCWRGALIYDRAALGRGEFWRAWTGHWVHFGWPHFVADGGLFLIMGWLLERSHPWFSRLALVCMPPFIALALYWFDPGMERYAGLSALNLGLLLFQALQGWRRDWRDWFWPAVLVIYAGEVIFEIMSGGTGGGMIKFDDPGVHVATSAHVASAVYAVAVWALFRGKKPVRAAVTAD